MFRKAQAVAAVFMFCVTSMHVIRERHLAQNCSSRTLTFAVGARSVPAQAAHVGAEVAMAESACFGAAGRPEVSGRPASARSGGALKVVRG